MADGGTTPFLIGAERSGSTLLRIMLDKHPRLAFRNEFEFAVDLIGDDGTPPEMEAYYRHLSLSRTFGMSGFEIDRSLSYFDLVRSFLEQKRTRDGKDLVGATIHRHFRRILFIEPEARFIHLLRDGRDVARSRVGRGWAGNSWHAAPTWVEAEQEIGRLREMIDPSRVLTVTYEDVVSEPEEALGRICEFLGLEYSEDMLAFGPDDRYKRPDRKLAYQWKRKADRREVQLLESVQAEMLEARGYELSGHPPHSPGGLERIWLMFHSRMHRSLFRFKRFGLRLWLEEMFSRRFGSGATRDRVRLKINEAQRRYLQ